MNIEHYQNFIKVVDTGNISSAARELLIAQPALSKQIKTLEEEFGTKLLTRGPRHVELTSAGKILYQKAKLIASLEEMVQNEIHSCILGNRGTLRLGLTLSYPDLFVENILEDFASLYPYVNYEIYEDSSDKLLELLKDNIVEVALIRTPSYVNPLFRSYKGVEETLMAVFHKDNPWLSPNLDSININLLKDVPLSVSRGFKQKVLDVFSDADITPVLLNVCTSRPTTIMWARMKKAVGLVTSTSANILETDILRCRPITGGDMSAKRSFTILKKHNLSSVAKSFLNFATEEAQF